MAQLKYYDGTSWVPALVGTQGITGNQGIQGNTGTQGLVSSATPPVLTDALWLDTTSSGGLGTQGLTGTQGANGGYSNPSTGTTSTAAEGVGYMGLPQNAKTTNYTLTAADAGKHIYLNASSISMTIPSNASVALPIGTTFTFINSAGTGNTITCSDPMTLANTVISGNSFTLGNYGIATAIKITSTFWLLSGNGIS